MQEMDTLRAKQARARTRLGIATWLVGASLASGLGISCRPRLIHTAEATGVVEAVELEAAASDVTEPSLDAELASTADGSVEASSQPEASVSPPTGEPAEFTIQESTPVPVDEGASTADAVGRGLLSVRGLPDVGEPEPTVGTMGAGVWVEPTPLAPSSPDTMQPPPIGLVEHEVQPGETLFRIGRTHGVSAEWIVRENQISDPTRIRPGQRLRIPKEPGDGWRRVSSNPDRAAEGAGSGSARVKTFVEEPRGPDRAPMENDPGAPVEFDWDGPAVQSRSTPQSRVVENQRPIQTQIQTQTQIQSPAPSQSQNQSQSRKERFPIRLTPVSSPVILPPEHRGATEAGAFCRIRYTVQPADTLASIAQAHGTTEEEVVRWNGGYEVHPGQILILPVASWIAGNERD